jgi:F-type H+/Na+-transporting ATPase subunit alpha
MESSNTAYRQYLERIGEIGFVQESYLSLVYVNGLPGAKPGEIVMFDTGDIGITRALNKETIEVLLLTVSTMTVGTEVVRTGELFTIGLSDGLLGRAISPLGAPIDGQAEITPTERRVVDRQPLPIMDRKEIVKPLETGVSLVDLVVPLGKGQRELIIGDRKTGKTEFLLQTIATQAAQNTICIYAIIGQKQSEIQKFISHFKSTQINANGIIVAASSTSPAGMVFMTPYTAMTIAEYFREKGRDVLLILDDMTTHARIYRQISLLARRFPGRSAYPGDIFYLHAKLVERAGNFEKGSITCLPVAESMLGDLSGFIQTNLMSMTDGHIFFDIDFYNQGKRPAINPFLSVTRVGHQTQSPLERSISRELSSFLVNYERMKQFTHFGAEVGESTRKTIAQGGRVDDMVNQGTEITTPITLSVLVFCMVWAGVWGDAKSIDIRSDIDQLSTLYKTDSSLKSLVDSYVGGAKDLATLISQMKTDAAKFMSFLTKN